MSTEQDPAIVAASLTEASSFQGTPEITEIHYDLWVLRITLRFKDRDLPVRVTFQDVYGFRVLDEGDLSEFWSSGARPTGWLWHVTRGGWLDLERRRPTFLSGHHSDCNEYLVVGQNDCVSILAAARPQILTA